MLPPPQHNSRVRNRWQRGDVSLLLYLRCEPQTSELQLKKEYTCMEGSVTPSADGILATSSIELLLHALLKNKLQITVKLYTLRSALLPILGKNRRCEQPLDTTAKQSDSLCQSFRY
jgi:hypothetical protein